MAYTSPFDPKTSEARSSWLAGLTEAMSIVTRQLDLKDSGVEEVTLTELFIDDTDRRRIYQASEWNKLWLTEPAPVIKKNGKIITQETDGFTIDHLGGSIAFDDLHRPEDGDTITAEVNHLLGSEGTDRSTVLENIKKQLETLSASVSSKAEQSEVTQQFDELNTTLDKKFADVTQKLEEANTAIESANGEIAKKQDKLSFDKQPTAESVNPVESSGIKSYVDTYATQAAQDAVDRILDIDDAAVETLWSESA